MMDILHGMMRTLAVKSDVSKQAHAAADHVTVFREFLSHFDCVKAQPRAKAVSVKTVRVKPSKPKSRRSAKR
jgi:hypothetical protein